MVIGLTQLNNLPVGRYKKRTEAILIINELYEWSVSSNYINTNVSKHFKMMRTDKLDTLLNGLLYIDKRLLADKPVRKKITVNFLCDTLNLDYKNWEMKSLKNELIEESHILETNGELRIIDKGKKFQTHQKGYSNLEKIQKEEEMIRVKSIEKFKYEKFSFWISIIAIIIAGLSLVITILKP